MKRKPVDARCPCGSGAPLAACCGASLERAREAQSLDRAVFEALAARAQACGLDPLEIGVDLYQHLGEIDEARLQIIVPWTIHHVSTKGTPLHDRVLVDLPQALEGAQKAWWAAQQEAHLSVWEVTRVIPGIGVRVTDRLVGGDCLVIEEAASDHLLAGMGLLGRVVAHEGVHVFSGVHPHPLMALGLSRLLEEVRERLAVVDRQELRGLDATRVLIESWERELDQGLDRPLPPAYNADGEELVVATQRWAHDDRQAVLERLRRLPDVEVDEDALSIHLHFLDTAQLHETAAADDDPFAILHQLAQTVAFASLTATRLEMTANSQARAERVAAAIEEACKGLLRPLGQTVSTLQEMQER